MRVPLVELIYDADCPNVGLARRRLEQALSEAGQADWLEWDRSSSESPAYACRFGSPTILIDGIDVAGEGPSVDACACRVYDIDGHLDGAPAAAVILSAYRQATRSEP